MNSIRIRVLTVVLALAAGACGGGGQQAETRSAPQSTTSAAPAPAATTTSAIPAASPRQTTTSTVPTTTATAASTTTTTLVAPDGAFVPPVGGSASAEYTIPVPGDVPAYYPVDQIPIPDGGFVADATLSFIDTDTGDELGPTLTVSLDVVSDLSRDELADFYRTTLADLGWDQSRDDFVEQDNGTTARVLFFFERDEATPIATASIDVVDFASRDDQLVDITVGYEMGEGMDDWPYFGTHAEEWFAGAYLPGLPETPAYQFRVTVADFSRHRTQWTWDVRSEVDDLYADIVAQFPFGPFQITELREHPDDKYDNFWSITVLGGGIQGNYVLSQDPDSRIVDIWLEFSVPRF